VRKRQGKAENCRLGHRTAAKKAFDEKWVDLNTQISYNEVQRKAVLSVALGDAVFERGGALRRESNICKRRKGPAILGPVRFLKPENNVVFGLFLYCIFTGTVL
jgi:hypothetical protein